MSDNIENVPTNTVDSDTVTNDTVSNSTTQTNTVVTDSIVVTVANTDNLENQVDKNVSPVTDDIQNIADIDVSINIKKDNNILVNEDKPELLNDSDTSDNENEEAKTPINAMSSDPLTLIFNSLIQDLIKPPNNTIDFNSDLTNLIEQMKKETDNSKIFGFDIKYDPETKMTSCKLNPDLMSEMENKNDLEEKSNNNLKSDKSQKSLIDFYSSTGNLTKLDSWFEHKTENDFENDYSSIAIDSASLNNKIDVLNWWFDKHKKYNLPLKYTVGAMDNASKVSHIEVLNWWYDSGLELKYTEKSVDFANVCGKISSLDWWLSKSKEDGSKVQFKYSIESFNRCKLEEYEIMELANWWNTNKLDIKYSREFIDYMGDFKYIKLHKYLMDNKMIKPTDTLKIKPNIMPRGNVINIMDLIGGRNNSKAKYDTSGFPEEIIKHIEEKESELDNNMLVNGKAKEYIDSLVKIPFGKFRNEKIFKFMEDFIKKLNEYIKDKYLEVLSDEERATEKLIILSNESDIVKFFKIGENQTNYVKLYDLYREFIKLRVKYLEYVDHTLNSIIYGHNSTKKQFKCIISQWLSGGLGKGVVIGVQGPPGVGKTSLIKGALAKCLVDFIDYDLGLEEPIIKLISESEYSPRPFSFISLGGSANGSTLIGHNITYHGATHGDIVKCLKQAKVMNPIIFFDELDKISKTENGYEISSVLTHITDPVQNEHFTDRYFTEVPVDLSKAIIVFSYNDATRIDRILLDRIKEINVDAITVREKVLIAKNFIIPEICKNIGYSKEDISLTDEQIQKLVLEFTFEAGVRKLKEKLEEIIRTAHLDRLLKPEMSELSIFEDDYIQNVMNEHHKVNLKKINTESKIGCINGMYATTNGLGDIMQIQIKKTYSKEVLTLQTTGSLEKVISESMNVAKTVAWNLLNPLERNFVMNTFTNTGIHIHCPDGSTSKDGPSAGAAITSAMYSLFKNKPIKNDISMTGEIDLDGNITAIGGLDAKLTGAKRAGVKVAYVPEENRRDIDILKNKIPDLIDDTFKVEFLSHISQAITKIF